MNKNLELWSKSSDLQTFSVKFICPKLKINISAFKHNLEKRFKKSPFKETNYLSSHTNIDIFWTN